MDAGALKQLVDALCTTMGGTPPVGMHGVTYVRSRCITPGRRTSPRSISRPPGSARIYADPGE